MAKGFRNIKPRLGRDEAPRIEDLVDVLKFKDGDWTTIRFIEADILSFGIHWIKAITKDGKTVTFPKQCLGWDRETEELDKSKCPYCKHDQRLATEYWAQAIDRDAQENEPSRKAEPSKTEKKTGFKDGKDSKTWTPIRYVRLTPSLAQKIQRLADINKVKGEKKDVNDPDYGIDVQVYYDSKAAGTDKYQVQKGERSALTDEEKEYLLWNLDASLITVESKEEAEEEIDRIVFADEEGNPAKKGKAKLKVDDDDDDCVEEDLDDGDEEEEVKPKKGKAKRKADDDGDLDDDLDEDEEEEVKPRKGKKKPVDDDLDDDDEPPVKKKGKKKPVDDDDDFDDLDGDEEEEVKPKKGKAASKAKRKADEDDDDFDDLDDDDD